MVLFPAELAEQGGQRGQPEADAALLSEICRSSVSSATTTSGADVAADLPAGEERVSRGIRRERSELSAEQAFAATTTQTRRGGKAGARCGRLERRRRAPPARLQQNSLGGGTSPTTRES